MAVSVAEADRINRVLTTTLQRYSSNISNELARNDGIIGILGAKKRIKVVDGGERAVETLDVSENTNFDFRSHYADVPTARQDSRKQALYAWATVDGAVTLNDVEKAMNMGDRRIYNLLEAEVTNAKNTIVRKVADVLRKATPGANDPESIQTIVENNTKATQSASPGGLSKSTNTWWRNEYSATAMDLSGAGLEIFMAFIENDIAKGTGKMDRPDFGLTTGTLFAALAYQGSSQRQFTGNGDYAKLGFANVNVNGVTIISDPSITAGDCYLLNTDYLKLQVLKTPSIKTIGKTPQTLPVSIRPFITDPKSLHSISIMYLTFALTSSSCQRQGIATNCT